MTAERTMGFLGHLEELRWRLVKAGAALVVGAIAGFIFREQIQDILLAPYRKVVPDAELVIFRVTEGFSFAMRLALFGGLVLSSPVLVYQGWAFIHPGLSKRERRWVVPIVVIMTVLFLSGVLFAYWILPRGLDFLLNIQPDLEAVIGASNYLAFAIRFLLVFGLAFLFPVFLFAAAAAGLVTSQQLGKARRWAVLVIVVLGAMVTPSGDPLTLLALSLPLYVFYEVTLLLVKLVLRR